MRPDLGADLHLLVLLLVSLVLELAQGQCSTTHTQRLSSVHGAGYSIATVKYLTRVAILFSLPIYRYGTESGTSIVGKAGFRIRIRINLSCWIRIRIQIASVVEPEPEPTKYKIMYLITFT